MLRGYPVALEWHLLLWSRCNERGAGAGTGHAGRRPGGVCYDTKQSQEQQAQFSRHEPDNVGPQLLTEGSVEGDEDDNNHDVKAGPDACFPLEIMERAYSEGTQIKITEAEASVKQDFARIINSINEVPSAELDTQKPDLSHKNCKEVTQKPLCRMPLIAIAGGSVIAFHGCRSVAEAGSK